MKILDFISITKDTHEYIFEPSPPYEVIENKYISKAELDEIRLVEESLNKFYNSNNFPKTMNYLFNTLKLNPYNTFLNLTKFINLDKINKLQFDEVTSKFYEYFIENVPNKDYLLYLIKQDYLFKFNLKPKFFWKSEISREERKYIYNMFVETYPQLSLDSLYRYAHLERYNNEYFIIIYKPKKELFYIENKNA